MSAGVSLRTAMSSAIEIPGRGNDSRPIPSGPQSLITHRNDAPPRADEHLEEPTRRPPPRLVREHALVLGEPAASVEAVPVPEHVERIEGGLGVDDPPLHARDVTPVVEEVEGADAERARARTPGSRTGS